MHYPPTLIYLFFLNRLRRNFAGFYRQGLGQCALWTKKNTTDLTFTPLSYKAEEITIQINGAVAHVPTFEINSGVKSIINQHYYYLAISKLQ